MTGKRLVLLIASVGVLYFYEQALAWGTGHALALSRPLDWGTLFPTHLSAVLTWMILIHTTAVLLISVPFALLIAEFGGPRAPVVALVMTLVLVAVTSLPAWITYSDLMPARTKVITAFDNIKLLAILPALVWLMGKLPSTARGEHVKGL